MPSKKLKFIDEVLSTVPPLNRLLTISVISKYAGKVIYIPVNSNRLTRLTEIEAMIQAGKSNPEIIEAIMKKHGVSERTVVRNMSEIFKKRN